MPEVNWKTSATIIIKVTDMNNNLYTPAEIKAAMTIDLYNPADKKRVRDDLLKEQNYICPISKVKITAKDAVLDHAHDDTNLVRAVLHRQANSFIGIIERAWKRCLSWWWNGTLSDALRNTADFLERKPDTRYRHDGWLKRVKTDFKKLNAQQQGTVLKELGSASGSNGTERLKLFSAKILDRSLGYDTIRNAIAASTQK